MEAFASVCGLPRCTPVEISIEKAKASKPIPLDRSDQGWLSWTTDAAKPGSLYRYPHRR